MPVNDKPVLIYDGNCGFCRWSVARWGRLTQNRVRYAATTSPVTAVRLVETDGNTYEGAEAVFRTLAHAPKYRAFLWMYRHIPAFAPIAEWAYRRIAARRGMLSFLFRV